MKPAFVTDHLDTWTSAIEKKSASGRGSNKKINLYGIKKLRELILELAVRGKLVPQDPNDEPASMLLEKIVAEKEILIKEKKIKKPKKLPEIIKEEWLFDLPKGWKWVRLNELGEWGAGATPKRGNPEFYGGNIPWFKSGELNADYISNSEETITELALKQSSLRYNKTGDVLLAMYGATIGKTSILKIPATTNQAVCACTPFNGFKNIFLLTLLKAYNRRFTGMGAGGAQPNISKEKIIATIIALPPTNEQHRIVAKVDELMSLCDLLEQQTEDSIAAHQTLVETLLGTLTNSQNAEELTQNWNRISDHFDTLFTTEHSIDQLKQSILQLAVMGKLVPQNPNDEPASVLLEKIVVEKSQLIKEGKIKKQKPLSEISEDEKPFDLPDGWEWCRGEHVADFIDPQPSHRTPPVFDNGVAYVGYTDIDLVNGIDFKGARKVSPQVFKEHQDRYLLKSGDFVFGKIGTLGKPFFLPKPFDYCLSANLILIQPNLLAIHPRYLAYYLDSPIFLEILGSKKTNSTHGVFGIKKARVLVIPFPPIDEQHLIVSKVDQLFALCERIINHVTNTQYTRLHLTDAIVDQAVG